jgi:hypothetical protein
VVGDVDVWEWCTGCGDNGNTNLLFRGAFAECDGSGADACALNNSGDVPAFWPYEPKFGVAGTIPDNSLFEGGINITQLIGPVCLTSFMVETRSSQSTDAVLKDFALREFQVCGFDASKQCEAAVASTGGGLDVSFDGEVDNTGVGTLYFTVSDDKGDITAVCLDDSGDGDCTGDPVPADLDITSGVATFSLAGGVTAQYLGSYSIAYGDVTINASGNAEATDTVTVEARINPADAEPLDTKMPSATCDTPVDGSVTISKDCTASINSAGDTLLVSVTGSGTNDGDVLLKNVTLTDTDSEVESSLSILKNGSEVTNGAFDLAPGDNYSFTASATESVLSHSNTITVSGTNAFTNSATSANDDASCSDPQTPSISVTKECSVELDFSNAINTIQLKVPFSGEICNTGNLKLTGLTASDSDAGDITLDRDWLAPTGDAGGMDCLDYDGFYLPSTTDGGDNPDQTLAEFSDTVTASATGALGTGTVSNTGDATCRLCPECPDCPTPE